METDEGPVDLCPTERARQEAESWLSSEAWKAPSNPDVYGCTNAAEGRSSASMRPRHSSIPGQHRTPGAAAAQAVAIKQIV